MVLNLNLMNPTNQFHSLIINKLKQSDLRQKRIMKNRFNANNIKNNNNMRENANNV